MGYQAALDKAWNEVMRLARTQTAQIKFLADTYSVDVSRRTVFSASCNIPAKDFAAVLILHYFARSLCGLPQATGQWLTFRELAGIEGYSQAFRSRTVEPIIRKYGSNPAGILQVLERMPAAIADGADAAVVVNAFEGVPVLIKVWKADSEFGADANLFFDASVRDIFCVEDIVVLGGFVAASV